MPGRGWVVCDRRFFLIAPLALALAGCGKSDDPLVALEAAVQRLQDSLEAKDAGAVVAMLDSRFRAQDELDADWARKTMRLTFLRFAQVQILAVSRHSTVEAGSDGRIGRTEAQVLLTGAQGLLPERVAPYAVTLVWWRDGADWKLRDLRWN